MQNITQDKYYDFLRTCFVLLSTILIAAGVTTLTFAQQPSDLDPTFGDGGSIRPPIGIQVTESTSGTAVQRDGKIVITKMVEGNLILLRYLPNGSPDVMFGTNGKVIVTNSRQPQELSHERLALQSDGKIVMVSSVLENLPFAQLKTYVYRFMPNGSTDTTFGINGTIDVSNRLSPSYPYADIMDLDIQQDNKIILAGSGRPLSDPFYSFILVRLQYDGSLDTSFSTDGVVTTAFQSSENYGATANGIAIQSDGKIVAVGFNNYFTPGVGYSGFIALARYNTDGSLDSSFGNNGKVITFQGDWFPKANDAVLQEDNKLIVVGHYRPSVTNAAGIVLRYEPDGSLDPSFGQSGYFVDPNAHTYTNVAVQKNGKIVCGGQRAQGGPGGEHILARYLETGTRDNSFDGDGSLIPSLPLLFPYQIGQTIDHTFNQLVIQRDGKIVWSGNKRACVNAAGHCYISDLGGWTDTMVWAYAVLVRYLGDPVTVVNPTYDFDGDGRSDVSVFRPSDSTWYLDRSTQGFGAIQFGLSTDKIVPADYDGDGKTDIAVYRDGTWWWINSSDSTVSVNPFGIVTDLPVPADYTGDSRDELAVYRNGHWWMLDLSNGQASVVNFGLPTDKPVPADYDGDGRVDQGIYRNGEWHINRSALGYTVMAFGLPSDRPVVADYDGDGRGDLAVYRDGVWYLLQSTSGFAAFQWGLPTDTPAPADYDGDGKTDAAVFRDGTWYINRTTGVPLVVPFGIAGDRPIPNSYVP